jgi:hypothetical protein
MKGKIFRNIFEGRIHADPFMIYLALETIKINFLNMYFGKKAIFIKRYMVKFYVTEESDRLTLTL